MKRCPSKPVVARVGQCGCLNKANHAPTALRLTQHRPFSITMPANSAKRPTMALSSSMPKGKWLVPPSAGRPPPPYEPAASSSIRRLVLACSL